MLPKETNQIKIACICASNQNRFCSILSTSSSIFTSLLPHRSMEAHAQMLKRQIPNVYSYGTGNSVKLPGPTKETANTYPFGTAYKAIYEDLKSKDDEGLFISYFVSLLLHVFLLFCLSYSGLGILNLLERNSQIKTAPEKFQELADFDFTIIFTFETTVFDQVLQGVILLYFSITLASVSNQR